MPGLFGILDLNPVAKVEEGNILFMKMADTLRHHKEDRLDLSQVPGSNLAIGRVGLPEQNPFCWPNHAETRESEIHLFVAGRLLDRETDQPISRIPPSSAFCNWHGFFSAVLTDPVQRSTLLVVDRRASFPIFYTQIGNQLLFASEVKALLASPLVNKEIDFGAFATFLAQGYLQADQTLFRSVKRLQGGELLRVENGKVVKETYWRFSPGTRVNGATQADLECELGHLVHAAVRKHMGEPEKTILFLSGGIDSRGILGSALEIVEGDGRKLNTVCWGASQDTEDSDVVVAASVARHLNTNHRFMQRKVTEYREHFTRANYLIDGLSDAAVLHSCEYPIMVELRNSGFEYALGGIQMFGRTWSALTYEVGFALANMRRLRDVQGLAPIIQAAHYEQFCQASDVALESALLEACDLSPNQAQDFFHFHRRLQTWLQSACYYKQIELDQRNPLLDDPILDFLARVPDSLRLKKLIYRNVFSREFPCLAQFPFAKRDNVENYQKLLATTSPLRAYALEELNDRSSGVWEFLDPVVLTKMLAAMGKSFGTRSRLTRWIDPKAVVKRSLSIFAPGLAPYVRGQRRARPAVHLEAETIILRSLALKNWYDTFVD